MNGRSATPTPSVDMLLLSLNMLLHISPQKGHLGVRKGCTGKGVANPHHRYISSSSLQSLVLNILSPTTDVFYGDFTWGSRKGQQKNEYLRVLSIKNKRQHILQPRLILIVTSSSRPFQYPVYLVCVKLVIRLTPSPTEPHIVPF